MLLNNELDDFTAAPGASNAFGLVGFEANLPGPGKRPLSSMSPTIVLKDGKPVLVTGTPGGSRIISTVLQVIVNVLDYKMDVAAAVAAPRLHHQWMPDEVRVERGFPEEMLASCAPGATRSSSRSARPRPIRLLVTPNGTARRARSAHARRGSGGAIEPHWLNCGREQGDSVPSAFRADVGTAQERLCPPCDIGVKIALAHPATATKLAIKKILGRAAYGIAQRQDAVRIRREPRHRACDRAARRARRRQCRDRREDRRAASETEGHDLYRRRRDPRRRRQGAAGALRYPRRGAGDRRDRPDRRRIRRHRHLRQQCQRHQPDRLAGDRHEAVRPDDGDQHARHLHGVEILHPASEEGAKTRTS